MVTTRLDVYGDATESATSEALSRNVREVFSGSPVRVQPPSAASSPDGDTTLQDAVSGLNCSMAAPLRANELLVQVKPIDVGPTTAAAKLPGVLQPLLQLA